MIDTLGGAMFPSLSRPPYQWACRPHQLPYQVLTLPAAPYLDCSGVKPPPACIALPPAYVPPRRT